MIARIYRNLFPLLLATVILLLIQSPAVSLSTREGIVDEKVLVDPSARYIHYKRKTSSGGNVDIHVVKIRLDDVDLEIRPALEGGMIKGSANLADIAIAEGAIAAINGGFFFEQSGRKLPVGELIINGELLSYSNYNRGCLLTDGDGEISLGLMQIKAYLDPKDYYEPIPIDAMNVPPGGMADSVMLYNRYWGEKAPTGTDFEVQVTDGVVTETGSGSGLQIPEAGYVIQLKGLWGSRADRFTDELEVGIIYDFDGEKSSIKHFLTGGPHFIEDGWPREFTDEYTFSANIIAPATRSCICITWNNELLFVVTRGTPLTFSQFGGFLSDLNVREAVGLDGGGSSGMWVEGVSTPMPSRPVPNAMILVPASDDEGQIEEGGLWGS